MMAASDDDCTLGAHFRVSFGGGAMDGVRVFSGKHCSSFSVLRLQAAGEHEVQKTTFETATNFFREVKDTHMVHFHPSLKVDHCDYFVKEVAPDIYQEIRSRHHAREEEVSIRFGERSQAIQEEREKAQAHLVRMLHEAISANLLQHSPREFLVLRYGEHECSICHEEPLGKRQRLVRFQSLRLNSSSVCLPCAGRHVFHRACLEKLPGNLCATCNWTAGHCMVLRRSCGFVALWDCSKLLAVPEVRLASPELRCGRQNRLRKSFA